MNKTETGSGPALTIRVAGHPITQGSKRAIPLRNGKVNLVESAGTRLTDWRHHIGTETRRHWSGPPATGPIHLTLVFWVHRPKRPRNPWPITRGLDIDKAARAALDALTGVAYLDDAQVVHLDATKRYTRHGYGPGVTITIRPAHPDAA